MSGFWADRISTIRATTTPILYERCEAAGMFDQIDSTRPVPEQRIPFSTGFGGGRIRPIGGNVTAQMYWDSDVAKVIEAAAGCLANARDDDLEATMDRIIDMYCSLQAKDGYLNSWYLRMQPGKRWTNLRDCHELYCAGHLMEAAVAYFEATGKRKLLDALCRYADHIITMFGPDGPLAGGYCGHEEVELALVKLARATGERRYLEQAKRFIDQRGQQPHYFVEEALARGDAPDNFYHKTFEYNQSHIPFRQQTKIVGHAVRAMYLCSAVADLVTEFGDPALRATVEALWTDLASKRLYVTGGLGPSQDNEGFTRDYDLPNESAYAETCASVGLVFWASRMLGFDLNNCYGDLMEQALYNGALSGISLPGSLFFYENPLESQGGHNRWEWHRCPCCPPNIARLISSIGQYAYGIGVDSIAVHLYSASVLNVFIGETPIQLTQNTAYPWDERVGISIMVERPTRFSLHLRLPGWCEDATIKLNGQPFDHESSTSQGYVRVDRVWTNGDVIELHLPMNVHKLYAHPDVRQNRARIALQRGPIVYCAEGVDNSEPLNRIIVPLSHPVEATFEAGLLGGLVCLSASALVEAAEDWSDTLYRTSPPLREPTQLKMIPYFAWDNRTAGEMLVWLRAE